MITRALLRALRNDLPMDFTLRQLGDRAPYAKSIEGRLRFVCPQCAELQCAVNPRNNLAHCFHCAKNINNIDLLLLVGYDFRSAAELLQRWLLLFQQEQTAHRQGLTSLLATPAPARSTDAASSIGAILQREFGENGPPTGS